MSLATDAGLWPFETGRGRRRGVKLPGSVIRRAASQPDGPVRWLDAAGIWHTLPLVPGTAPVHVDALGVEGEFHHAALSVRLREGQLAFATLDDPALPLFRGGTFFFDAQSGLATTEGTLWSLVPGRCVIGRSAAKPADVVACVQLPAELRDPAKVVLVATPDGPCPLYPAPA